MPLPPCRLDPLKLSRICPLSASIHVRWFTHGADADDVKSSVGDFLSNSRERSYLQRTAHCCHWPPPLNAAARPIIADIRASCSILERQASISGLWILLPVCPHLNTEFVERAFIP
jgi:hypothetical protein